MKTYKLHHPKFNVTILFVQCESNTIRMYVEEMHGQSVTVPVPHSCALKLKEQGAGPWMVEGDCIVLKTSPVMVLNEEARTIWNVMVSRGFVRV
jgi:hypothetical protein